MGKAKKKKNPFLDFLLEEEVSEEEVTSLAKEPNGEETSIVKKEDPTEKLELSGIDLPKRQGDEPTSIQVTKSETKEQSHQPVKAGITRVVQHLAEGKVEQAQALKIAQDKIHALEDLNTKLELELSELRSSGEVLYKNNQELKTEVESLNQKIRSVKDKYKSEIQHLETKLSSKNKEVQEHKMKVEALELQLKVDFQKIKSRERELENRLQIMKMENQALLRSKDELILELKRNLDELNMEIDNFKEKGRDLHISHENTKEKMRKSVKALRLALNLLEVDEEDKAETKDEEKKPA
tara:strand:- start:14745 stop:15632 length:888 start_codon:yes stop_codon:yes gene_type:complete